jgi:hypothetical protein
VESALSTPELDTRADENPGRGCTYAVLAMLGLLFLSLLVWSLL